LTILVTGFPPYKEEINASGTLIASLRDELPGELHSLQNRLHFRLISFDDSSYDAESTSLRHALRETLDEVKPAICIFTGQAPGRSQITVERAAINIFMDRIIETNGPVGFWGTLPGQEELPHVLNDRGIPAAHSNYAGCHLCNHILYSTCHLHSSGAFNLKAGFIHIPILPEQTTTRHHDLPSMPLPILRQAMGIIIRHVVESM
jgi:pyroglutamyl-peptidase I